MTAQPSAEHAGDPAAGTAAGNEPPASLWRDRNFAGFWTAQALSQLGAQLGQLAFPVLAVTLLGATEFEVGILNAAGLAAFLVVGLPAGAWVDRWLKRRTMIAADLVRMTAMAAVPLLWWAGSLQIWHLYVISAVVGVATVFFDVSYQSFVPLLVAPGKVGEANSKLEATAQLARVGGPAAGGALLTVLTAPLLFIGESLGYLLSAVFLGRTRDGEKRLPAAGRNSLGAEIREGLAFVAAHPLMRRIVLCTGGGNFAGTLVFTLLPSWCSGTWAWVRRAWGSSCRSGRPAGSWAPWQHRGSPGGSARGRSFRRAPWSARSSWAWFPLLRFRRTVPCRWCF